MRQSWSPWPPVRLHSTASLSGSSLLLEAGSSLQYFPLSLGGCFPPHQEGLFFHPSKSSSRMNSCNHFPTPQRPKRLCAHPEGPCTGLTVEGRKVRFLGQVTGSVLNSATWDCCGLSYDPPLSWGEEAVAGLLPFLWNEWRRLTAPTF